MSRRRPPAVRFQEPPPIVTPAKARRVRHAIELDEVWAAIEADPAYSRLRASATQLVRGVGQPVRPPVAFIGEAPGVNEDEQGEPFVGRTGELLNDWIRALGLRRDEVWITNAVKYRPIDRDGRNRAPSRLELMSARPHLREEFRVVQPRLIVPLGAHALWLVEPTQPISKAHGQVFTRAGGRWTYCPLFHPAYVLRDPSKQELVDGDLQTIRRLMRDQTTAEG